MKRFAPSAPDALAAVVIAAVEVGGAWVAADRGGEPTLTVAAVALLFVQSVPIAWARRAPVTVWAVTAAAALVYGVRDYPDPFLPLGPLVALFLVVALRPPPTSVVIGACSLGVVALGAALAGDSDAQDVVVGVLLVALACTLGEVQRRRDQRSEERRVEAARGAVADERARIAREFHDVVAHHVSMMVVQAEAGASAAGSSRDVERFDAVADTGRSALDELRTLLGVLRGSDHGDATRAPQPGLEGIDDLVREVRGAGLSVDVTVEGEPVPVPPGVALSAYRIVQEALTNTLRHAGPARATVAIRYSTDAVDVEISDDGTALQHVDGSEGGYGLVGVRERVALFGGSLTVGPRQGGGFLVAARLPVRPR